MKKLLILILAHIFLSINIYAAKNIYLSYLKVPEQVYNNQRFEVVIKALITTPTTIDNISTSFFDSNSIDVLNPDSKWVKVSNNNYENRYYFKSITSNFKLPDFVVNLTEDEEILETSILSSVKIKYLNIASNDKRFSNVIAKILNIKAFKTKQYNNKESLTIVDIDGIDSNLEDFNLKDIQDQGISKIVDNYPEQNLIYYFVMPVHKKKIVFNYYNTDKKSFEQIIVPLILQNELVSTQTDLNPNNSNFEKYKKIALLIVLLISIVLFIWKRNKVYLIVSLILLIVTILYLMPNKIGIVKKDSFIYILPTKNSTVFFKLEKEQRVEVLNKKKNFIKVMGINNKFIGWVKEENFGKN